MTRREVLKQFAKEGHCVGIDCGECPYNNTCNVGNRPTIKEKLIKIGANVILRRFPEKPKPTLDTGTKIEFSDGSTAVIETRLHGMGDYEYVLVVDGKEESIDYLIGKVWKVVEQ